MNNVQCDNDTCKFYDNGDCNADEIVLMPHEGHTICITVEKTED